MSRRSVFAGAAIAALLASGAMTAIAQSAGNEQAEAVTIPAGTYVLDPAHGKITWSVSHMGFSTYTGQFSGVSATMDLDPAAPEASTLEAAIDVNSVGTLNAALDNHLKTPDFFDVANFPEASFTATSVELTDADSAVVSGDLTLRGVTRPVSFTADFNKAGVNPLDSKFSLGFDGYATIQRSEFGVSYGVPMISDDVDLHLEAEFKLVEPDNGADQ
ncbi:YceI family protein [Hyphomonas sp.]|uniref:YceI family protein n=1 Tax=Hyphomonas sp. TaxID=87 RepID=UPI003529B556